MAPFCHWPLVNDQTDPPPPPPSRQAWTYSQKIMISLIKQFLKGILKARFHFNRTVLKRGVFLCLVNFQAELVTLGQKKTLRFGTVRLEWKTGRA